MTSARNTWNHLCRKMSWKFGFRLVSFKVFIIAGLALLLLLLLSKHAFKKTVPTTMQTVVGERFEPRFQERWVNTKTVFDQGIEPSLSGQKCVHPTLNPDDPAVMEYYRPPTPVDCSSAMKDWIYVSNGTFHISREAIRLYGEITCEYAPVLRFGDFSARFKLWVRRIQDGTPLKSDFFKVSCWSANRERYSKVHAAVARNATVMERLHNFKSRSNNKNSKNTSKPKGRSGSEGVQPLSGARRQTDESTMPQAINSLNLSVFMFGFDSMSHMAWVRYLPKTRKYFLETLGGIELDGYNIRGDGTPAALLPILTGKTEAELPEARRGYEGAKPVDNHPWIWKEFAKHGYVTAYAEDAANIGTVQLRMLGFKDQPTDHYMRPYFLAAEPTYKSYSPYCLGGTPRHVIFMNWFRDLFDMYRNVPKFFFGFHAEISHSSNNQIRVVDDDLVTFLHDLETKGHLNSTLLILMADHGARFQHIRATAQGRLEERMPYFSFRFPPWFHRLHPGIIRYLRINAKRLATPFDIHATLLDILNHTSTKKGDLRNRAISLFTEIPKERTCTDAEVFPHWCACIEWQTLNQSDPLVLQAVKSAIHAINGYTASLRKQCAELTLLEITDGRRYVPTSSILSAERREHNFKQKRRPSSAELYQVSFKTTPGEGHFEVTCKFDVKSKTFSVDDGEISRINRYGSQPACIQQNKPNLRQYCYCV